MPKKKPTKKKPKKPYQGWNLLKHGVTQSQIQMVKGCKDRGHKRLAKGLKSTDRKEAMEYGTIYHKHLEVGAEMHDRWTKSQFLKRMREYISNSWKGDEKAELLCKIATAQYLEHRKWDTDKPKYKYIDQEPVFAEKYKLPPTRFATRNNEIVCNIPTVDITLRGRIDEVIRRSDGIWIQENKTKSRIDISFLQDTVPYNIQVMFYAVAASLKYKEPIKGVIYNVIRKPGQRQRKNESDDDFVKRIAKEIEDNPNYYFYRLSYRFQPGQLEKWKKEELNPALYEIYAWWRSWEKNPENPWEDEDGNPNPFHGRKSFGIYDALSQGKGEFFDLIVNNSTRGLVVDFEMFPELQDD